MGIFKKSAEDPALNREFSAAKKRKPDVPFDGPDGEYNVTLSAQRMNDEKKLAFLDYIITDEGEFEGITLTNVYSLSHSFAWDNLLQAARNMGIDVDALSDDPALLDTELDTLIHTKRPIKVSVSTKGDYKNVVPVSSGASQGVSKAPVASTEPDEEEWEEELQEDDESSYVGAVCVYEDEQFIVDTHDATAGTLDLADMKEPDTLWYQGVPIGDVEFVMDE